MAQAPAEEAALLMFRDPRVVFGLMAFWALVAFIAGQCSASNLQPPPPLPSPEAGQSWSFVVSFLPQLRILLSRRLT